ncbi:MAG: TIGR01459 family HAD-type hydrolase [Rickettsiales bacterium]
MKIDMTLNLEEIITNYDALIVDLWGVIHDGSTLYPGVAETLALLHQLNKPVLFLSNAPRLASKARENLDRLNIPRAHYLDIITSGQVAHDLLARDPAPKPYYYLGPSKDEGILDDLPHFSKVSEPQAAEFILCTGYEVDFQPHDEIIPLLAQLLPLPMLCVNPDMEVVKQDGTHWPCAGMVAAEYTRLGGRVAYIGKPFREVYEVCKLILGNSRVLCVGDNPATDIKGANDAGFDCLLVVSDVLKSRYGPGIGEAEAREICAAAGVKPTYVLAGFGL